LSLKSDASRYLWFDWHARWTSIEVQPSSIAKYSLAGLPHSTKVYDYASSLSEGLADSEAYLSKIFHARKNYLSTWSRLSYFYLRTTKWAGAGNYFFLNHKNLFNFKRLLHFNLTRWSGKSNEYLYPSRFYANFSTLNRPNAAFQHTLYNVSAYSYFFSTLTDILARRDYLYFLLYNNKSLLNDFHFKNDFENKLFTELYSFLPYIHTNTYRSEADRSIFLWKSIFFKNYFNSITSDKFGFINLGSYTDYFTFFMKSDYWSSHGDYSNSTYLLKSQYKPMRRGITNMVRLQATSAIAMPTEIRLHILASSKDVIHSWAIPSAGIKIDCVPGYSSHRVAIFLVHGIFWGQCMEICGRYHHWMPIVVYFMKRDLFFLWCAHFIHYSDIDNSFNMVDGSFTNSIKSASHNTLSWVAEFDTTL
jgi:heme/copper-type cytochrome/quinol oxidase subunit 2